MRDLYSFEILEHSQITEMRRIVCAFARSLEFDETQIGKLGIAVSEAAENILKHAGGGEFLVRSVDCEGISGIELLAVDSGPGMDDIAGSMKDSYSAGGTLGIGLGAIKRLSSFFDIYSVPGRGTAVLFRLWSKTLPYPLKPRRLEVGVVGVPKQGEEITGDGWMVHQQIDRSVVAVVDGLGHGILAADAASEALRAIREHVTLEPKQILEKVHRALKSTRGAAVAVAEFLFGERIIHFCGVGNITAKIVTHDKYTSMVSFSGTAGYELRKVEQVKYNLLSGNPDPFFLLVMHTDGLSAHCYPGLLSRHPSMVSGMLYRDFKKRNNDDITVLTARLRKGNLRES